MGPSSNLIPLSTPPRPTQGPTPPSQTVLTQSFSPQTALIQTSASTKSSKRWTSSGLSCNPDLQRPCQTGIFLQTPRNNPKFTNQPLGVSGVEKLLPDLCERAGTSQRFTNHCLRATFITNCHEAGISNTDIQHFTGHRSIDGVEAYKHPSAAHFRNVQANISKAFTRSSEAPGQSASLANRENFATPSHVSQPPSEIVLPLSAQAAPVSIPRKNSQSAVVPTSVQQASSSVLSHVQRGNRSVPLSANTSAVPSAPRRVSANPTSQNRTQPIDLDPGVLDGDDDSFFASLPDDICERAVVPFRQQQQTVVVQSSLPTRREDVVSELLKKADPNLSLMFLTFQMSKGFS